MAHQHFDRKLVAILYADIAGYSRLTAEDEEGTHRTLRACLDAITSHIQVRNGRVVHYAGDAVLAEFGTVTEALSCAVDVQRDLKAQNKDLPDDRKAEFRIGINLGEVIIDQDEIHGHGVNIAARLESLAEPGGICISDAVRQSVQGKLDLALEDLGEQEVKNIRGPVRAYRVLMSSTEASKAAPPKTPALEFPGEPSLAVLPFINMNDDAEQEYFSNGITEDIITGLCRFRELFVIAHHSSFVFKGQSVDITEVAKKLGVRYVLKGSVRKTGNRVRVTAQLVDGVAGNHVWADRYDHDLENVFLVQDDVTQKILCAVTGRLEDADEERALRKSTVSLPLTTMCCAPSTIWLEARHIP